MNRWPPAFLALALFLPGCASEVGDGSATGAGGATGSDGDGGGGGMAESAVADLFLCDAPVPCWQDMGHLGGWTAEWMECAGKLLASGEPGGLLSVSTPGPFATDVEDLIVLDGRGIMFSQRRARCSGTSNCYEGYADVDWYRDALYRCTFAFDPVEIEGCGSEGGDCSWAPRGDDCTPVADAWTCTDLGI